MTSQAQYEGLVEWLAGGRRGLSSDQIVTSLTGLDALGERWGDYAPHHPHDPADLARCRRLLDAVPALKREFHRMAAVSKEWAALVPVWDELCALMDEEAPDWERGKGEAPRTFERMQELRRTA